MTTKPQDLPFDKIDELKTTTELIELAIPESTGDLFGETFAKPAPIVEERRKETRGRKPKSASEEKPPVETKPNDGTVWGDKDKDFVKDQPAASGTTKVTLDKLVSGKVLINSFDKIMTILVPLGVNSFLPDGQKIKPSEIAATKQEKETLEPVVTECAKQLPIDFSNPWVALTVCVCAVYGSKVAEKISFSDEQFAGATEKRVEARGRKPKVQ